MPTQAAMLALTKHHVTVKATGVALCGGLNGRKRNPHTRDVTQLCLESLLRAPLHSNAGRKMTGSSIWMGHSVAVQ